MRINPVLNSDFYKQLHHLMLCKNMTLLYSNITPRKSRISGVNKMVFFGLQYYIKEYLINQWNDLFFKRPKKNVIKEYERFIRLALGIKDVHIKHLEDLHDLGYLPLEIKALPEGSRVNIRVPCLTIKNTNADFGWLVNFLETSLSNVIWAPCTTATIAVEYRKLLNDFADITGADKNFIQFQAHDFAQRGYSSVETSMTSGAGHLLSFVGTDTIPAILFLEEYYDANIEKELVGTSVPATEHSVMCVNSADIGELETFRELITKTFPTGIISIVSDTWDLWKVCTEYLTELKDVVLARDGKVVIRPDSGDPADIICGTQKWYNQEEFDFNRKKAKENSLTPTPSQKGVVELLWNIFGGTMNEKGYKVLDPHIGAIYGDSITLERAQDILERLKEKGFASSNIVFGIGLTKWPFYTEMCN